MKKALFILLVSLAFTHFQQAAAAVAPASMQQADYPEPVLYYMAPFDWSCQLVFIMNPDNDTIIDIYSVNTATQQRTYYEHDISISPDGKSYSLYVDNTDDGRTVYTYGTINGTAAGGYGSSATWSYIF
ncbi:hypothetical protein ACQKLP_11895 [Chitinophaga sp. NPDC101104]|uniref:hypothetical protein n=1 Tax=Chitinophaga sp. NPDC101104 TaxID=3390561 RepID=UPI003D00125C